MIGSYRRVKMARMTAYSMMALKMLKIQRTMKLSMALRLLDDEEGALALEYKDGKMKLENDCYLTALKVLMMTRKRMTKSDILPGTTLGSMMKLIQDTVTNKKQGQYTFGMKILIKLRMNPS